MFTNTMYALIPALLAYGAGLPPWWCALVWWGMYRVEFWYDAVSAVARAQVAQTNIAGHLADAELADKQPG